MISTCVPGTFVRIQLSRTPGEERRFKGRRIVARIPACSREDETVSQAFVSAGVCVAGTAVDSGTGEAVGDGTIVSVDVGGGVSVGAGVGVTVGVEVPGKGMAVKLRTSDGEEGCGVNVEGGAG